MDTINYAEYSVLMSVYEKENPEFLNQSVQSMLNQTKKTNDFVLVCDGILNDALYRVVDNFCKEYPEVFNVIQLNSNLGIGSAANIGLSQCKNELVAKMDSDDISHKNRCAIQLAAFNEHPDITIIGTDISEFEGDIDNISSVRCLPAQHQEIYKFAKRRSPFNNQTIMFKKKSIMAVGGYSSLKRCEDYDLFVRVLSAGYKAMNINQPLVSYRLTPNAIRRRGTLVNTKSFILVRWKIFKSGYSSFLDFLIPCLAQLALNIMPIRLQKYIYRKFLRKS